MNFKFLVIISLLLFSCSPQKRLARLLKKNPNLVTKTVTLDTIELFRIDTIQGEIRIVKRDSIILNECPEINIPEPRYKYRYSYKKELQRERTIRDSIQVELKKLRLEMKTKEDIAEIESKVEIKENRGKSMEVISKYTSLILLLIICLVLILKFFRRK